MQAYAKLFLGSQRWISIPQGIPHRLGIAALDWGCSKAPQNVPIPLVPFLSHPQCPDQARWLEGSCPCLLSLSGPAVLLLPGALLMWSASSTGLVTDCSYKSPNATSP